MSTGNIKDQMAALLYATGVVHDNEEVDIEFNVEALSNKTVVPITLKIKKRQEVELIKH